jgi:mono/diheme cytochrome c family protein
MTRVPIPSFSAARIVSAAVALVALLGLVLAQGSKDAKDAKSAAGAAKYIGADKCKNCHSTDASGNAFAAWQKSGHAKAFATLASDAAKKIAKEKGIDDPQKSDKCVKCHETAFGLPADMIKKGFDATAGVQCESCHGPGEAHMKARMAAAMSAEGDASGPQKIPAGELVSKVDEKTCATCHNSESPTFKPFCFCERSAKIAHLDPRKPHPKEATPCSCEKCKAGKCPVGACGPDAKK